MSLRPGVLALALSALLLVGPVACDRPKKASLTGELPPAPIDSSHPLGPLVPTAGDGAASQFVSDAADYARHNLRFANPRLSYLLLACTDMNGHLDPHSSSCTGSVLATFEDEPRGDEVAFVVLGKTGIVGGRATRADAISLAPARCTVDLFLDAAKQAGTRWSAASDVFLGYGATASGAAWMVRRGDAVLFSTTDARCAKGQAATSTNPNAATP
jgi:hypothetical protein